MLGVTNDVQYQINVTGQAKMAVALIIAVLSASMMLSGCSTPQDDPMQQTIPTDAEHWQKNLETALKKLPDDDRKLLSRYMIRMKLSQAYESGAIPRTTIEQALVQQREYERLHPDNPTGKRSPVAATNNAAINSNFPIVLLPVKSSVNDSLNQVKLQFVISNHGNTPIKSFKGTLLLLNNKANSSKKNTLDAKPIVIPRTQFVPPIMPDQSGIIAIDTSIEDINVMRAIQNPQNVSVHMESGTVILTDGRGIEIGQQAK